jgi:DNA-3-methyladenine glycosylase
VTGPLGTPLPASFYDAPVVDVARALVGCVVSHGGGAGVIVETEAYHHSEAACHAHAGLTARTRPLFGPPGRAYVYRSYGIHALLNAVAEPEGVGAAVLIRALQPVAGVARMHERRRLPAVRDLCSGPGKLTQALGIGLEHNGTDLARGPVRIHPPPAGPRVALATGTRIGITRAVELPWRFCVADSRFVSRPWPRAAVGEAAQPAR